MFVDIVIFSRLTVEFILYNLSVINLSWIYLYCSK
nr:MAG TPA: hypothetical protein [Caudoviricetes sp.]